MVWVALCVLAGALLAGHTMWFDELQAWNIARASHSLGDLWSNLRYEGHPVLWYLPLYALTRVTGDPRAMQVFEWLVLCATYALVVFRAPFPLAARAALAAGYFVTFEYGVISRGYGLGVLLLLVALDALHRERPRRVTVAVALGLLAWTSLAGAVLALAFAGAALWTWGRRALGPAVGVGVAAVLAVITCRPPADFVSFSLGIPSAPMSLDTITPTRVAGALAGPWRGLVPLPRAGGGWNSNLLDGSSSAVWVQAALGLGLVVFVGWLLREHRFASRLWMAGVVGYLAFSVVVVLPDRSHYAGEFFLLLVACLWCAARSGAPARESGRGTTALLVAVLVVQVLALVAVALPKTTQAFSPEAELAAAAERAGAADLVVSGQDFHAVAMAGFLDRPVYSVARGEWIRFLTNDRREADGNAHMTNVGIVCAAARLAEARARTVVLVTDRDFAVPGGGRLLAADQGVRLIALPAGAGVPACASTMGG